MRAESSKEGEIPLERPASVEETDRSVPELVHQIDSVDETTTKASNEVAEASGKDSSSGIEAKSDLASSDSNTTESRSCVSFPTTHGASQEQARRTHTSVLQPVEEQVKEEGPIKIGRST